MVEGNSLYVFIGEHSLESVYQAGSSASANNPYVYQDALFRENLTDGQWGDPIANTTNNALNTYQFTFDMANATDPIDIANAEIFAFIIDDTESELYTGIGVAADGGENSTGTGTVGINDPLSVVNFSVAPNPANNTAFVTLEEASNAQVNVFDLTGRMMQQANTNGTNRLQLNLEGLAQGIYTVAVEQNGKRSTQRLVVH